MKIINALEAPETPNPHGVSARGLCSNQRDMLIESPARIPHRLLNQGDEVFRFLVVKTPKPTRATRIL